MIIVFEDKFFKSAMFYQLLSLRAEKNREVIGVDYSFWLIWDVKTTRDPNEDL